MLRAFGGIAGVRASQEFAEGTLLGLAERIAKISHTVRVAGEPRKCGSASSSAPGVRCGSCFPEHPRSNRGTVFAGSSGQLFPVHTPLDWVPVAIGVVWALGFLAITLARCRSWLGVRAALRASTPIELPIPVPALITPGAEEPGVVGFLRPVLVLPAQLPGTPESSTAWRDSHARAVPRAPPGQSLRRRAHDGGGDLLVPSAGVVDWIAHG